MTSRLAFITLGSAALCLACPAKEETTTDQPSSATVETSGDTDPAVSTTGTSGTTGTGGATADTADTVSPTTTEPGTSSGGGCGVDAAPGCGISVEDPSSACDMGGGFLGTSSGGEPPVEPASLEAVALGGGEVEVTETGFSATCCRTLVPAVTVEGMTIAISYTEEGDACDCVCSYTIGFTLTGVPGGSWTIASGELSTVVDVP